MTTHRCGFCDSDYRCDTTQEVSDGVYRCECKATNECHGCSQHGACEDCGKAPATGDGHQPFYCQPCEDKWIDNYSGPEDAYDGGVTIAELTDRAHRERAELRRRD